MDRFIPREKLSKRARRELDAQARKDWGALSPVTRKSDNPKAYNRKKIRQDDQRRREPDFFASILPGVCAAPRYRANTRGQC